MPIDIDGFAVLAAIAREPQAFAAVRNEASRVARTFVIKQIKEKTTTLETLKTMAGVIGAEALALVLDGMSDAEIKALLGRIDKQNAAVKAAAPDTQRARVVDLIEGRAEPERKPAPAKAPRATKPRANLATSRAMGARKKPASTA